MVCRPVTQVAEQDRLSFEPASAARALNTNAVQRESACQSVEHTAAVVLRTIEQRCTLLMLLSSVNVYVQLAEAAAALSPAFTGTSSWGSIASVDSNNTKLGS
jgi:hypothetical protein